MMAIRFVYLPRPDRGLNFARSRFESAYGQTLALLEREMKHLDARNIVIQAGFEPHAIRNDGWPRSGARPSHPAVILSFHSRGRDLSFPCLRYGRYEDNLRAIALSLDALRAVDRYGVTQRAEQYTGWAQIAAPGQSESLQELAIWLASVAVMPKDYILESAESAQRAYRAAAMKLHPDKGGSRDEWDRLQRVKEQIDAHFASAARGAGA